MEKWSFLVFHALNAPIDLWITLTPSWAQNPMYFSFKVIRTKKWFVCLLVTSLKNDLYETFVKLLINSNDFQKVILFSNLQFYSIASRLPSVFFTNSPFWFSKHGLWKCRKTTVSFSFILRLKNKKNRMDSSKKNIFAKVLFCSQKQTWRVRYA